MQRYELHTRRLINVATLPCESQNTENVILLREFTKENNASDVTQLHQSGPGSSCALNLLICGVIQQCVYEMIQGVDDL